MKSIIRANVFETNSSSMHSLTISKDAVKPVDLEKLKLKIDPRKIDRAHDFGHFGAGLLTTVAEKLCYIWCAIKQHENYGSDWATDAEETLKKWLPNCTFVDLDESKSLSVEQALAKVKKAKTVTKEQVIDLLESINEYDEYPSEQEDYYINHQSNDVFFVRKAMQDKEFLAEILSDAGTIRLDSDCDRYVNHKDYKMVWYGYEEEPVDPNSEVRADWQDQ